MDYGIAGLMDVTQSSFFVYILPWLLTFAIVFGILGHYEIPKNKSARAIIAIALAFFVMPVAAPVVAILGQLGMGLVMLFAGLLFILILFEMTGIKHFGKGIDKGIDARQKITEKYYRGFGVALAILAIMVFIGAGGLGYLGYSVPTINYPLVFFIGIIVLMIWWMVKEGEE
ncbi:MAG: hypothetical protein KAT37_02705 [Candidatus Aenigmarchaeota archaeon]|nr:hypothetical protein [Candidatus Aenigmarchaeota archaeon]